MTPERRKKIVEALREIRARFMVPDSFQNEFVPLEDISDSELTAMIVSIEALVDRAQGTDI